MSASPSQPCYGVPTQKKSVGLDPRVRDASVDELDSALQARANSVRLQVAT